MSVPTNNPARVSGRSQIMPTLLRVFHRNRRLAWAIMGCVCFISTTAAQITAADNSTKPAVAGKPDAHIAAVTKQRMRTAVERGLKIVQKAAGNYPKHRQCFSCHHQTLPLFAMKEAKDAGFKIDEKLFKAQVKFTRKSFRSRIDNLKAGKGIGGRAMTVAYGLWTLYIAEEEPDDLSAAMVTYLIKTQRQDGSWRPPSHRPPLEESAISCTTLASYSLLNGVEIRDKVTAAYLQARKWRLLKAKPKTTEDHIFLLMQNFGDPVVDYGSYGIRHAEVVAELLKRQQPDGGWAQQPGMKSDAYATGQVLSVLTRFLRVQNIKHGTMRVAARRGITFLFKTQQPDGSWFVKTRSRPVQKFFDNGDPYGKSQFISIAATSWAIVGLTRSQDWIVKPKRHPKGIP